MKELKGRGVEEKRETDSINRMEDAGRSSDVWRLSALIITVTQILNI